MTDNCESSLLFQFLEFTTRLFQIQIISKYFVIDQIETSEKKQNKTKKTRHFRYL